MLISIIKTDKDFEHTTVRLDILLQNREKIKEAGYELVYREQQFAIHFWRLAIQNSCKSHTKNIRTPSKGTYKASGEFT